LLQPGAKAAARMVAAYRRVPDAAGNIPAADATNAELWSHVKRIVALQIKQMVKDIERDAADDDLDTM
jgi:hypothetical protein